uniref:Uncharacterized protein n=1 Tax=Siphoviridae sp. ct2hZ16 TaxID=2826276 RepID=A0A8S5QVF4_9CAUD|nr:MAG TPA: hypothetical protein [Siphoviridae sp. ct2hZ16]
MALFIGIYRICGRCYFYTQKMFPFKSSERKHFFKLLAKTAKHCRFE